MDEILLNIESKEIRYAHLRNGRLRDLHIERMSERLMAGNIYRGRVTNILRNIQSAFIDIGEQDNGFIHISDIIENTQKFERLFDMDFDLDYDIQKLNHKTDQIDIAQLMKVDQPVLVQVVKEPIGSKGARLTSNLSIAGRYLVLLPNSSHRGVSRKIEDRVARDKLKRLIRAFEMPKDMGLICRTASSLVSPEMLIAEAHDLIETWNKVVSDFHKSPSSQLLYAESDIIKRAVLKAVDRRFQRIVVDDYQVYQACKRLYQRYASEHPLKIECYQDKLPLFEKFNVEKEIDKALKRKIWLPSGGYLFLDRTEAMYTIDVNSGRSSQKNADLEESLVQINLEAVDEISRQLKIRNIGGLIICDFIDMRLKKNQRRVLEKLKECMKEDSAKCTILGMSEFGLVEMTRQRSRGSLAHTMLTHCPYCSGAGMIKTHESVSIEIERSLKKAIRIGQCFSLKLVTNPELDRYLKNNGDKDHLEDVAEKLHAKLVFDHDDRLHLNDYQFYSTIQNTLIDAI